MRRHPRAHPTRRRRELTGRTAPEEVHVAAHELESLWVALDCLEVGKDEGDQPGEVVALARQYLEHAHLLACVRVVDVLLRRRHVLSEPEPLLQDGVAEVCAAHVLVHLGEGEVEVEVEGEDDARDEDDEDGEGGVLEVGQLDLHRPELGAPADVRVALGGGRLPAHGLPVGGLDVFEVVRLPLVVELDSLAVDDERVAHEEVGDVLREDLVDPRLRESAVRLLVHRDLEVVPPQILQGCAGRRVLPVLPDDGVADVRRDCLVP
mmetsp:Transcript_6999/g.21047  ORF Transcript_6999/g.21047 Transcript_6999/m.21047 type:complete len:264 (-) Transcript_6999:69-860(-)